MKKLFLIIFITFTTIQLSADPPMIPMHGSINGVVIYKYPKSKKNLIIDFQKGKAEHGSICSCHNYYDGYSTSGKTKISCNPFIEGWFTIIFPKSNYSSDMLKGTEFEYHEYEEPEMLYFIFRLKKNIILTDKKKKAKIILLPDTTFVFCMKGEREYGTIRKK